jgi:predicted nucleic acid-binding protein
LKNSFIDSNVILYLLSGDHAKADKAESILQAGGIISVQVLNEVVSVCRRKLKMEWGEIDTLLNAIKACLKIVPLTETTHELAVQICKQNQLSFYDAHICSAALVAGAQSLLSEDMQDGMKVNGLVIQNPFRL